MRLDRHVQKHGQPIRKKRRTLAGSSLANLGVMLPGMASGWLCDQVGYHRFFLWALMATIPIFLIAWRIPFAHPDTEEGAAQAVEKELTDE